MRVRNDINLPLNACGILEVMTHTTLERKINKWGTLLN